MNLQYLNAFYVTVKFNSISKAAKILHLTQPGLSTQIRSLEEELQSTLLYRSNKGVQLTDAGRIVYDYAQLVLSLKENVDRDLANLKTNKKILLIGACQVIGQYVLPSILYKYKTDNKDTEIGIEISNTGKVIENILNKTINIGLVNRVLDNKNIETHKFLSHSIILVAPITFKEDTISINELINLPLICREKGSGTRSAIEECLNSHNIHLNDLNIIYELNSNEAIKASILLGKGISFISEIAVAQELKKGLLKRIFISEFETKSELNIIYRKDYRLNTYEEKFIKHIKAFNINV